MRRLHRGLGFAATALMALRLALPKLGIGWMAALLTSNFNRVAIHDLQITALVITALISLHHLLSPFQVVFGQLADRHTLWGLRRTPYILVGALLASLVFPALPSLALAMSGGSLWAVAVGVLLLLLYGIGIAANGDGHHALIAEVTSERSRGAVIALVWTVTIISAIASAIVIKVMMPVYTPEAMQRLYNLTPFVVVGSALLGIVGIERRVNRQGAPAAPVRSAPSLFAAVQLLRTSAQTRLFFAFMFMSILGIFMQDAILEVYGADVFKMTVAETTTFSQTWGVGVLAGMVLTGALSAVLPISKKSMAMLGGAGTALGMALLTLTALSEQRSLLNPALLVMGVSTGLFNVGALSLMMDMTLEGATGTYMGLWGMSQAFGTAFAAILSGGLKSALIETSLLSPALGYAAIFGLETIIMVISIAVLRAVSVDAFRGNTRTAIHQVMELGAMAS
jgi:BCD family chlorophyll transporter-like MFS transporter